MGLYYYFIDPQGHQHGPVPKSYFKEHLLNGHSWVWHEGLPQWVEAHTIPSIRKYTNSEVPRSFSESRENVDLNALRNKTPHSQVLSSTGQADIRINIPKTWMLESILVTIFCCFPFGVIGIIYASKVIPYWRQGLYGESVGASLMAAMWTKISLAVSILIWIVYMLLYWFTPLADKTFMWYNNYIM